MKRRSHHPYRESRKLSRCKCKWCGEEYWAERSDSEYCCDSHKTLACNKRSEEKRALRRKELEQSRQFYARKSVTPDTATQTIRPPSRVNSPSNENLFEKFQKQMDEMLEKSRKDQQWMEEKYEFERMNRLFIQIGQRLFDCDARGDIRAFDLKTINGKIDEILNSEKIHSQPLFSSHVHFIRDKLSSLIEDLLQQEKNHERYRMPFKLPDGIIAGVRSLAIEIQFPKVDIPTT